ncbi:restriction endonuclease subunit S [Lactococcus muris]|uniref:restriction endonuclease subunit S n=1 Tax=Lactococcus muris TaxID=2941330 RepID=UPI00203EF2D9|nr:restriction endonuclease subunit S [Lactococcus muris]
MICYSSIAYYEKLPNGWDETNLGSVGLLISGRDLTSSEYTDTDGNGVPYITGASSIIDGVVNTSRTTTSPQVISKKSDILITIKGTVGTLAFNPYSEAHIARQIMAFRPYLINVYFLMNYFEARIEDMRSRAKSMIPGVSRDVLLHLPLAVPPLNEQKRIVNVIEKISQQIYQID